MNKYMGLFLSNVIETRFLGKYSFANMCNQRRLQKESLLLPTTKFNTPDYEYMEIYAKNIMNKKYRDYLDFVADK